MEEASGPCGVLLSAMGRVPEGGMTRAKANKTFFYQKYFDVMLIDLWHIIFWFYVFWCGFFFFIF